MWQLSSRTWRLAKPSSHAQDGKVADQVRAAVHWDAAYAQGDDTRSWFEEHPGMSLRMLDSAGFSAADALIDIGGGASPLTRALLDRGFRDLTVLDVSVTGMQRARDRLGSLADRVHWLTADILTWHPQRRYQAWHDRANFHFLTRDQERQQYLRALDSHCQCESHAAGYPAGMSRAEGRAGDSNTR